MEGKTENVATSPSDTEENVERNSEEGVHEYTTEYDDNSFSTKSVQDKWLLELIEAIEDDNLQKVGELFNDREDVNVRFDYHFRDDYGDNYEHFEIEGVTPLILAAALGKPDIVQELLNRDADISAKTFEGETPFFIAARFGHLDILKILFKGGSHLLEERSERDGATALLVAVWNGHYNVFEFLLDNGANITAATYSKLTALHIVCMRGDEKTLQLLLVKLSNADNNFSTLKAVLNLKDDLYRLPLHSAALSKSPSMFLQVLETIQTLYFPYSWAKDEVYIPDEINAMWINSFLLRRILRKKTLEDKINQHMKAIMYWAILNGSARMIEECKKIKQWEIQRNKSEVSWMHIAALGGNIDMMKYFLEERNGILDLDDEGVTPLHLAVRYGHLDLVKYLLKWLEEPPRNGSDNLKIVLATTKEGETPISLAASGSTEKLRKIEGLLWETLNKTIRGKKCFFESPCSKLSNLVLELAAQYEAPREEMHLHGFLQMIPEGENAESLGLKFLGPKHKWNALHLAVYHQRAVVVWWLLSNGGYMNENDIKIGIEIIKKRNKENKVMVELLSNPPPILKRRAPRDDHHLPEFQFQKQDHESPEGMVVGFHVENNQIGFQFRRRSINDLIYNDGPQKIIRENKYSSLEHLVGNSSKDTAENEKTDQSKESQKLDQKKPSATLIWTHIPLNNLRYIEELMVRISRDKDIKNETHRPLAQFVRRSWTQLSAGEGKHYMKPQCMRENSQQPGPENSGKNAEKNNNQLNINMDANEKLALYMPYISWMDWPENKGDNESRGKKIKEADQEAKEPDGGSSEKKAKRLTESNEEDNNYETGRPKKDSSEYFTPPKPNVDDIVHNFMTLDQYYYASLDNTAARDNDQVLGRYTKRKREEHKEKENKQREGRKDNKKEARNKIDEEKEEKQAVKILTVNQLWLWILDERTIITSTTKQPDDGENSLLQHVLNAVKDQEKNTSSFCAGYLAELILNTTTSLFSKREINVYETKTSPLDVFRDTIRDIRDVEANLFEEFQASLSNNDEKRKSQLNLSKTNSAEHNSTSSTNDLTLEGDKSKGLCTLIRDNIDSFWKTRKGDDDSTETNPYFDITKETAGLREVKDICDELNILKALAEAQELVWKQAMCLKDDHLTTFNYDTPTEKKEEIQEMIKEAETVQNSLEALLDLKQKQANISEAKSAREQSHAAAKQADTIMVFTAVTILFLPASFLTSLFALNISSFPHKDGDVAYEGQWIFPIIFGGSLGVSTFFMAIAFGAHTLKGLWSYKIRSKSHKDQDANRIPPVKTLHPDKTISTNDSIIYVEESDI